MEMKEDDTYREEMVGRRTDPLCRIEEGARKLLLCTIRDFHISPPVRNVNVEDTPE